MQQEMKTSKLLVKKPYKAPQLELIKLDTDIALSMVSVPPNPGMMPQMPEGYVQKIFKIRF